MFRLILLSLLLSFASADAQTVRGRISNLDTGEPLRNVSIYYDGSSVGTISKEDGTFILQSIAGNASPVIFSCIGYFSETIKVDELHTYTVKLAPRVTMLQTVQIGAGKNRNAHERWFKREFLGAPADLKGCDILNMGDLFLNFKSEEQTLLGSADEPLVITNPYLGYTISYGLMLFQTGPTGTLYQGTQFFTDNVPATSGDNNTILERRKRAYDGSTLHFIRAIWHGSLEQEGFIVSDRVGKKLMNSDLCVEKDGKRYLKINSQTLVVYKNKNTYLRPVYPGDLIDIDQYGFFDPSKIKWSGEMVRRRIAGLLPFDYQP